jgi:lincosamide nucleotidyltransferase A/C/D/E
VRATDVIEIVTAMREADLDVCLDGGWGVDALVGLETRPHKDLDLLVSAAEVRRAAAVLDEREFDHRAGTEPSGLYCDAAGRRVDISVLTPDEGGGYVQETSHGTTRLTVDDLSGRGTIEGVGVRCLTAAAQRRLHTGYVATDKGEHDLRLLGQDESDSG